MNLLNYTQLFIWHRIKRQANRAYKTYLNLLDGPKAEKATSMYDTKKINEFS